MIACFVVKHFAAVVARQVDPALLGVPLLLVAFGARRSQVVAVSGEAAALGAAPGLSLSRARGLCPNAIPVPFDAQRMQHTVDILLSALWEYTDRIEVDDRAAPETAVFYLDLGRLNEANARRLADQAQQVVQQALGVPASAGLADGKFTAYAAAMTAKAGSLIQVARPAAAAFLAPLPVHLLPLGKVAARLLDLLLIREIGQFATLPREAVVAQFGREGKRLHALANGLDSRPVKPRQLPSAESLRFTFDDSIVERARLDVAIHEIAARLSDRLDARASAAHELILRLTFADDRLYTEQLHFLQPITNGAAIARAVVRLLERQHVLPPVTTIEVRLSQLVPDQPRQLELFGWKPRRTQLLELARLLVERHGITSYEAIPAELDSLMPERRFQLRRVDAS